MTPTIDVHAHFTPPTTEEERVRVWQAMLGKGIYFPEPHEWSLERTLRYMDESGTAMQLLSNIPASLPSLRASNDYGATLVRDHPSRFGLLAALPTDDPAAATAEATRAREVLDGEVAPGIRSVAAPLRDGDGRTFAAVNVTAIAAEVGPGELIDDLLPLLLQTTGAIGRDYELIHAAPQREVPHP